jgi:endonuclease VIII
MPEGPEIKRAADQIAKAVVNQPIKELFFAFEHLKPFEAVLRNRTILSVKPKGKALLTQFDNGLSIYSHNQLYGVWMIRNAYNYPSTNRQLRLAIHTHKKSALLYSASDIEVVDEQAIALHPFLSKLGLDILDEATTVEQVRDRFTDKRYSRRKLHTLLLDQQFLCGLGNYLRSEVLFVAKIHPNLRPMDCSEEQIEALAVAAIALPRQSYQTKGITNDLNIADSLKLEGKTRREYRHYVFSRKGRACHLCDTEILKEEMGGRRLYYCPSCQANV